MNEALAASHRPSEPPALLDTSLARLATRVIDELIAAGNAAVRQEPLLRKDIEKKGVEQIPTILKDYGIHEGAAVEVYAKVKKFQRFDPVAFNRAEIVAHDRDYLLTTAGILYTTNPFATRRLQSVVEKISARRVKAYGCITTSELMQQTTALSGSSEARVESMEGSNAENQLNKLIEEAIESGSSDIHIQPQLEDIRVLMRRDGKLNPHRTLSYEIYEAFSNLILQRSSCETGRVLHDINGQFSFDYKGLRTIDVRMAAVPQTVGGRPNHARYVLRLLGLDLQLQDIDRLGFSRRRDNDQIRLLRRIILQPNGLTLVTGKTGSGKTTTLLAILAWKKKHDPETAIFTLEDPVEKELPQITHIGCNASTGGEMTFQRGLKQLLRLDPDAVMVGEIRDVAVANLAIEASMTGQLVLSTLHTNTAGETINRLIMMGVHPTMLSDALTAIIGQRVIPKVCQHCCHREKFGALTRGDQHPLFGEGEYGRMLAELYSTANERCKDIPEAPDHDQEVCVTNPRGCDKCRGGTSGRHIVAEILMVTDEIRELIVSGTYSRQIVRAAIAQGFRPMIHHGMELVGNQVLSYEAVARTFSRS